jgi:hypothetical protein
VSGKRSPAATLEQRDAPAAVDVRPIEHARRVTRREQVARHELGDRPVATPQLGQVEMIDSEFGEPGCELGLELAAERQVFEVEAPAI